MLEELEFWSAGKIRRLMLDMMLRKRRRNRRRRFEARPAFALLDIAVRAGRRISPLGRVDEACFSRRFDLRPVLLVSYSRWQSL